MATASSTLVRARWSETSASLSGGRCGQEKLARHRLNADKRVPSTGHMRLHVMATPHPVIPSTAGVATLHLFKALEELVGSQAYQRALARLPAAVRGEMEAITAVSWAPISLIADVVEEIARCARVEVEELVDRAVRLAAERSLKTVWRMFLRVASDDVLVKRAGLLYSRSRNVGQLHGRMLAPGHAELLLSDWPDIPERQLRAIGINIASTLSLAGRHDVRLDAARTADGSRYELRWRV
jgi:hypothetical protein